MSLTWYWWVTLQATLCDGQLISRLKLILIFRNWEAMENEIRSRDTKPTDPIDVDREWRQSMMLFPFPLSGDIWTMHAAIYWSLLQRRKKTLHWTWPKLEMGNAAKKLIYPIFHSLAEINKNTDFYRIHMWIAECLRQWKSESIRVEWKLCFNRLLLTAFMHRPRPLLVVCCISICNNFVHSFVKVCPQSVR